MHKVYHPKMFSLVTNLQTQNNIGYLYSSISFNQEIKELLLQGGQSSPRA